MRDRARLDVGYRPRKQTSMDGQNSFCCNVGSIFRKLILKAHVWNFA